MANQATQLGRMVSRPDPMLSFRWMVKKVPYEGESWAIDDSYIENFETPFNNIDASGIFMGGGRAYFPEFHDVSAFSIVFYGDSLGKSLKYLWTWKQKVKSFRTGLYSLPNGPDGYKQDFIVALLDAKGDSILELTYKGCWPTDTSPITLDQEGSTRITHSQTFSTDDVEVKFLK